MVGLSVFKEAGADGGGGRRRPAVTALSVPPCRHSSLKLRCLLLFSVMVWDWLVFYRFFSLFVMDSIRTGELKHFSDGKPTTTFTVDYVPPFMNEAGFVKEASVLISLRNAEKNISASMKLTMAEAAFLFKSLEAAVERGLQEEMQLRVEKEKERGVGR
jgi:hypothetical protein